MGEIWSKGSNLTSYILTDVFAEVAEVNAEVLDIKSYQPWQKHCQGSGEAKCIFTWVPLHFICHSKKMLKFEGWRGQEGVDTSMHTVLS